MAQSKYKIVMDSATLLLEGWQIATNPPAGKSLIVLEEFEEQYIIANIKPWKYDNDACRYIFCGSGDDPIMSLISGYYFRLRTDAELAEDPEHPIYQICWFHMDITDPYSEDPPGIQGNGTDQLSVAIALRSGPEATDPIMTQIDDTWRITIRKVVSENDLTVIDTDVRRLTFVDGERSFNYTSTQIGTYIIVADDFPLIEAVGITYQVKMAQPVIFKVWQ